MAESMAERSGERADGARDPGNAGADMTEIWKEASND
jgi:hypothetical protein